MATTTTTKVSQPFHFTLWKAFRADPTNQNLCEELLKLNEKLVYKQVNFYSRLVTVSSKEDLLQAGKIGLLTAIRKYDPYRGIKFSTYATPWIISQIVKQIELEKDSIVIPRALTMSAANLTRAEGIYMQVTGNPPDDMDVFAEFLGLERRTVELFYESFRNHPTLSLNCIRFDSDSGGSPRLLIDEISGLEENDPAHLFVEGELFRHARSEEILQAFDSLPKRSRDILLLAAEGNTNEVIGRSFNLSREGVRKNIIQSVKKLRNKLEVDEDIPIHGVNSREIPDDPHDQSKIKGIPLYKLEEILKSRVVLLEEKYQLEVLRSKKFGGLAVRRNKAYRRTCRVKYEQISALGDMVPSK